MNEIAADLARWQLNEGAVRERMFRSPTPRERERWLALWLLVQGWTAEGVAEKLERDPHTIGDWLAAFRSAGPPAMAFEQTGGAPPPSMRRSRPR
jgi:transposase